jgi:c-Jun-amino-terminal kinase-interacting protein 4
MFTSRLLQTFIDFCRNALNIVKDDLIVKVDELTGELEILREELNAVIQSRNKLKVKVGELEDDLRKAKEQMKQQTSEQEDDGDVPMAQRKRFTRVEMARVLMERNQYKERFMELQDAVRWTEMMRATKVDHLDKKSKQSVWKFFSNLFSSNDRAQREPPPMFRNSAPGGEGRISQFPAISGPASGGQSLVLATKDFNESHSSNDGTSERAQARRREQYRQVRAHVQKEDGRLQAYGWSLPGASGKPASSGKSAQGVPVPVPVYCRPLAEASPHMKVWCASGVNLNGGYTKDGGCVVGASVFYSRPQPTATITEITTPTNEAPSELESLDKQMKLAMDQVDQDQQLSSFVWICTSTHSASTVTVIDAKNPAEVLDSFPICQTHLLCICTVIGALEMDYHMLENSEVTKAGETLEKPGEPGESDELGKVEFVRVPAVVEAQSDGEIEKADEASPDAEDQMDNPTSVGPTMWLGAQNGMIYVHSSVGRWRVCLHAVQLPDAVLSIVHVAGRVVVALANGQVAIFRRQMNGEWDVNSYHLLTLGSPKHSVRCLTIVGDKVWAAHRNRIHVLDPITLNIAHSLEAHPRKESQIRQMAATGLGVWVSIRLDSTLRLYHSQTYEHLQDVDIEPYVSKMLGTGKLGFSFVRITSLHVSCGRLWIGTGNGVIISVPLAGDGNGELGPWYIDE